MGYKERCCQICGVRFNLGRIRRIDEPLLLETAWNSFRGPKAFRQSDDDDGGDYDDGYFWVSGGIHLFFGNASTHINSCIHRVNALNMLVVLRCSM